MERFCWGYIHNLQSILPDLALRTSAFENSTRFDSNKDFMFENSSRTENLCSKYRVERRAMFDRKFRVRVDQVGMFDRCSTRNVRNVRKDSEAKKLHIIKGCYVKMLASSLRPHSISHIGLPRRLNLHPRFRWLYDVESVSPLPSYAFSSAVPL